MNKGWLELESDPGEYRSSWAGGRPKEKKGGGPWRGGGGGDPEAVQAYGGGWMPPPSADECCEPKWRTERVMGKEAKRVTGTAIGLLKGTVKGLFWRQWIVSMQL